MGSVCSTAAPAPQEPATPTPAVAVSMAAPTVECCRTISLKREKTNKFKLASEYVSHASMGAASVLDGCPFQEEKKGNACLLIIDPQIDFHEGGSLGVPGATKDSERIAALLLKPSFLGAAAGCAASMRPMDWTVTLVMAVTLAVVAATIIACWSAPDDAAWAKVASIDSCTFSLSSCWAVSTLIVKTISIPPAAVKRRRRRA